VVVGLGSGKFCCVTGVVALVAAALIFDLPGEVPGKPRALATRATVITATE
jgi:hypothetical protein